VPCSAIPSTVGATAAQSDKKGRAYGTTY